MTNTDANAPDDTASEPRLSTLVDLALRMVALALVIAGAAIGLGKPAAIALIALGLLLLIVEQTLKHLPGRRPPRAVIEVTDDRWTGTPPSE
jgi:hypothetical protein